MLNKTNVFKRLTTMEMKSIRGGNPPGDEINCKPGPISCTSDVNCTTGGGGTGCKCNTLTHKCFLQQA